MGVDLSKIPEPTTTKGSEGPPARAALLVTAVSEGSTAAEAGSAGRVGRMAVESPHRSEADLLVLHALRLKGLAEVGVLVERSGLDDSTVRERLAGYEASGYVSHREGRISGWSLTPAGRAENERMLREELDRIDGRGLLGEAYGRFGPLNLVFLELCTAWQLREVDGRPVLNDHSDPYHDRQVKESLTSVHGDIVKVCDDLGGLLARFAGYEARFESAVRRIAEGEDDWFTKPVIDSYHTVWFELHEDFLATLGIERSKEGS